MDSTVLSSLVKDTELPSSFTSWAGVKGLCYYNQQNMIYPCIVAQILRTKKDIQKDLIFETNSYEVVSSESGSELVENTVAVIDSSNVS
jgi:hypothetical protein